MLPNIFDKVSYSFSPGFDYTANFEKELSEKFNINAYMAEASVERPPLPDNNFDLISKLQSSHSRDNFITLFDWLSENHLGNNSDLLLQMEIEAGEYEVLTYEDSNTIASFAVIVIEFHNLQKLFEHDFLKMVFAIFEKIYRNFSICHVNPNNCCGIATLDGVEFSRVIEVTFIRNDILDDCAKGNALTLPHALDSKNVKKMPIFRYHILGGKTNTRCE